MERDLERVVTERASRVGRRHVGLAVGAMTNDAKITVGFGRREANGPAPDGHTIFQIGSVTKVFTAVLLADAANRGEVRLDQPLASIIPEAAAHPSGVPITLGALWSTADDLLTFAAAHLHPDTTALGTTLRQATQPRARVARHLHVALGWHLLERHGAAWLWHNGGTGGFRSFIAIDMVTHTSVCVLANTARSVDRLGMKLLEHIRATQ